MSCADFILAEGEKAFRDLEGEVLGRVAARSGLVISCGGGVVERAGNRDLVRQNCMVVHIDRPLDELAVDGRPISERDGIKAIAARRAPLYAAWADMTVSSRESAEATACAIRDALPAMLPPAPSAMRCRPCSDPARMAPAPDRMFNTGSTHTPKRG